MLEGRKVVGILGGMGPRATADLFEKIISLTPATHDQEHLKVLVYNNPQIPDRTDAILNEGKSPLPALVDSAKILESAGADFLVIPCNTAHYFYDQLQERLDIPVINMIEEVVRKVSHHRNTIRRIGLMGTTGTLQTRIYDRVSRDFGIRVMTSPVVEQEEVMRIIYDIKSGAATSAEQLLLTEVAERLVRSGAEGIVLGCTELPLLFNADAFHHPLFLAQDILAERVVEEAFVMEADLRLSDGVQG